MASSIGVRIYRLRIHKIQNRNTVKLKDLPHGASLGNFFSSFEKQHGTISRDEEKERSWSFSSKKNRDKDTRHGWVSYGMFGLDSRIVDPDTDEVFNRQSKHSEIIPLYYHFWNRPKINRAYMAFEQFAARSCSQIILHEMQKQFEKDNSGWRIAYELVAPTEATRFFEAPVKEVRLIRTSTPNDVADQLLHGVTAQSVNVELALKAKRSSTLFSLGNLRNNIKKNKNGKDFIVYEGTEFDKVKAKVDIGGKTRTIGVYGTKSDAGLIDITDDIQRIGSRPTLSSMDDTVSSILADIDENLKNEQN